MDWTASTPCRCKGRLFPNLSRGCQWHIGKHLSWSHLRSHGFRILWNNPPGSEGLGRPGRQQSSLAVPPELQLHWRPNRSHKNPWETGVTHYMWPVCTGFTTHWYLTCILTSVTRPALLQSSKCGREMLTPAEIGGSLARTEGAIVPVSMTVISSMV